MRYVAILLSFLYPSLAFNPASSSGKACHRRPIKVAVIDTGIGYEQRGLYAPLCKSGHIDYTKDQSYKFTLTSDSPVPIDYHSHGTNIAGLITKYASQEPGAFCLVIIKYWVDTQTLEENVKNTVKAIRHAIDIKADIINYSSSGHEGNEEERKAVKEFLNRGGVIVSAAGNDNLNIDLEENKIFLGSYDRRIIIVGNKMKNGRKNPMSNYGNSITTWEYGTAQTGFGITHTGTSQATAIVTGKLVKEKIDSCSK